MIIGTLRPESSWVGQPIGADCRELIGQENEIIAILRGKRLLLPHDDTQLQSGDKLLTIVSPGSVEQIEKHLTPLHTGHLHGKPEGHRKYKSPKRA